MSKTPYHITFEWSDGDFLAEDMKTLARVPTPAIRAEKSEHALRATMETIQDIGERIATTMNGMSYPPASAEVEFGVRLKAESGVITKSNQQAHFVIKLVWNNATLGNDPD